MSWASSRCEEISSSLVLNSQWVVLEKIQTSPTEEICAIKGGRKSDMPKRCLMGGESCTVDVSLPKRLHFVKDHFIIYSF